jgi:hypothetical protein
MKDDERAERLAAALRANLRRRKAQARGSATDGEGGDAKDPANLARPEGEHRDPS